ncbi:MAG: hypothetical protein JWM57_1575 [Phycisphaerales bacterium]|nr:hypothetical protein [Phycisphaerales bacterium]
MPSAHAPPRRDPRLRLALHLETTLALRPPPPDPVLTTLAHVMHRLRRLQTLERQHMHCTVHRWRVATRTLTSRLAGELRELQYTLGSVHHALPVIPSPATVASVYRDLIALDEEFNGLEIADDLSSVAVVTEPVVLEGVALGRFRLVVDLSRLGRGRLDGDTVTAEALEPNPSASNDEITHPHVQGGCICFGDGGPLLRAALAEGRLYDALVVTRQVLLTYNEASPYVRLDRWTGRRCEECDDLVGEDDLYGCQDCGTSMCGSCEASCADCDSSHCRRCLREDGHDLVCRDCLAEREARADEEDDTDDDTDEEDPQPPLLQPCEALHHEQIQT